jgi:hypothetical protein
VIARSAVSSGARPKAPLTRRTSACRASITRVASIARVASSAGSAGSACIASCAGVTGVTRIARCPCIASCAGVASITRITCAAGGPGATCWTRRSGGAGAGAGAQGERRQRGDNKACVFHDDSLLLYAGGLSVVDCEQSSGFERQTLRVGGSLSQCDTAPMAAETRCFGRHQSTTLTLSYVR